MIATEEFRAAMRIVSLDYDGPIHANGKLSRFKAAGDRARNSWCVIRSDAPAAGLFGCRPSVKWVTEADALREKLAHKNSAYAK